MTSVPPTQPPAAPETDAAHPLTNAEIDLLNRAWLDNDVNRGIEWLVPTVEGIVAERVRVVEGERDAARVDADTVHAAYVRWRARAESAEAAHRALQAAVEALAAEWAGHLAGDEIRALLAGGEER